MTDIAISVNRIGKLYQIGGKQAAYNTLRDTVADVFVSPFRKMGKLLRGQASGASELDKSIWALRDVSFQVSRGEVIGIIGSNGAGKSTLLKILSRITEPTEGFAEIYGRVGSLLEVGTGFHPELTGRENLYLNGAILGMKRTELQKKFDEIVNFAEVEKFIDTPVKHYSSGMYLRLAFAVAAHLEPEILLVDEVLAVGDANFQKKCINKMQDVGREGRTVFFVSHNMMAISRLCKRAILIDEGTVKQDGPATDVVSAYLGTGLVKKAECEWPDADKSPRGNIARLRAVRAVSEGNIVNDVFTVRQPVTVAIEYDVLQSGYKLLPNVQFYNEEGMHIFSSHDVDPSWRRRPRPMGRYTSSVSIPENLLSVGLIFVSVGLSAYEPDIYQFHVQDAVAFQVVESYEEDTARGDYKGNISGFIRPLLQWHTSFSSVEAVTAHSQSYEPSSGKG